MEGARALEGGEDGVTNPGDAKGEAESDGDSPADLPFGVALGSAQAHPGGYVVSAVDARQGGSHAVLAWLDPAVARGSVLDLGRVFGDAEPPRFVLRDSGAFVVVPDMDASGHSYRYGWVRGLDGKSKVEWLGSFEQSVDDSAVFALASTAANITVAWDEVEQVSHLSHVRWASWDASGKRLGASAGQNTKSDNAKNRRKLEPDWLVTSTGNDIDAEGPQLVAHGAGYWLAYLVAEPTPAKASSVGSAQQIRPKAAGTDEEPRVVELGRRWIEVLPLDANGRPNGKPIRVADRSAHVVAFDIEATPDGGAIVAYRDSDATPGVEAQTIEVARVRPDGGVLRYRVDDERVGAGTPVLLVDAEPRTEQPSAFSAWLAVSGSAGETRLAKIPDQGQVALELVYAPQLAGVEPLLWRGDTLLVARHRSRFVEFERVTCAFDVPNPPVDSR